MTGTACGVVNLVTRACFTAYDDASPSFCACTSASTDYATRPVYSCVQSLTDVERTAARKSSVAECRFGFAEKLQNPISASEVTTLRRYTNLFIIIIIIIIRILTAPRVGLR